MESITPPRNHHEKYMETIKTLPKAPGWSAGYHLYQYQGFWHDRVLLAGTMSAQEHFIARPSDIFLCSSLKSGTTWLKALAFAIVTRTRFHVSESPLLTNNPHVCMPCLEWHFSGDEQDPQLPLLATHIPFTSLPKSIIDSKSKVVYIYRDPKDVFVSLWHFLNKLLPEGQEPFPLDEAFGMFSKGLSVSGPYCDHVLGYLKAKSDFPDQIFILKYEDLLTDTTSYVKKLADFMGYAFTLEEEKEGLIQEIIKLCRFDNLSNLDVNKTLPYFRKGKAGDWESYLNAEMAREIDQVFQQEMDKFSGGLTSESMP